MKEVKTIQKLLKGMYAVSISAIFIGDLSGKRCKLIV